MGIRDNFKKGSVEMILLMLLAEGDKYGYQLSQEVSGRSGGLIAIPEGSMYPTLYKLEENGYISDYRELVGKRQTRVYYHMEDSGKVRLDELKAEYKLFNQGMRRLFKNQQGGMTE